MASTLDKAVAEYQREKARAKAKGKPVLGKPEGHTQEPVSPVAAAQAALDALAKSGLSGATLEAARRAILAGLVRESTGIQQVAFPEDGGAPPGFRAMDVRVFIPQEPMQSKNGRLAFVNDAVKLVHNGRAFTFEVKLYEYAPEAEASAQVRAERLAKAVSAAMAVIPK